MLGRLLDRELLACPVCRGMDETGFKDHPLALAEVYAGGDDAAQQGLLFCANCGTRYPVIDGVAVVFKDVGNWLRQQERSVLTRTDLSPHLASWLMAAWDDDADPNWRRQMLSIYARSLGESEPGQGFQEVLRDQIRRSRAFVAERQSTLISALGEAPVVVDIGAAVGATSMAMATQGATVIALDHEFGPLRLLAELLAKGTATAPRWRHAGYDYVPSKLTPPGANLNVVPLAADALDPPLRPGTVDMVTTYNVLDNVSDPIVLIRQIYGMLRSGGAFVSSSPYDWVSRCTPRQHRLGESVRVSAAAEPDAATAFRDLLQGRFPGLAPGVEFELGVDDAALPWILERHDRSFHVFLTHYIEAHKPSGGD